MLSSIKFYKSPFTPFFNPSRPPLKLRGGEGGVMIKQSFTHTIQQKQIIWVMQYKHKSLLPALPQGKLTYTIILCYIVLQLRRCSQMKDTITIRLPEKLQKELENVVKAEKTSKSEIIRDAVARYLASRRFQQLRKKVLPFAEAQGLITDEDVFKAIS